MSTNLRAYVGSHGHLSAPIAYGVPDYDRKGGQKLNRTQVPGVAMPFTMILHHLTDVFTLVLTNV